MRIQGRFVSAAIALLAVLTVVTGIGAVAGGTAGAAGAPGPQGNGSVDEAWLTGATPGDQITLMKGDQAAPVGSNPGTADALGSLIIRNLTPGRGYHWVDDTTGQQTPPSQCWQRATTRGCTPPSTPTSRCTRG
ncbi:MAG: hypothetical protein ACLQPH_06930 [Acidimicrobiales bacterium]